MPAVLWFRRDLRRHDNPALLDAVAQAGPDGEVVALFVLDPVLWGAAGDVRRAWLARSLRALDAALDGGLVVRHGDPATIVPEVAAAVGARSVHVAADFGPYGAARDTRVAATLEAAGRELVATGSPYAVAPGRVRKGDGTPYRVYTPFFRAWSEHGWRTPASDPERWPTWRIDGHGALASDGLPDEPTIAAELPPVGEAAALERWARFRADGLAAYDDLRNRADLAGTSNLSAHLRWGEIHPRTLLSDLDDSPAHDGVSQGDRVA